MAQVLVGRCEICDGSFELPLVYDPATWRTEFDVSAMTVHQAAHQAARARLRPPTAEPS